jgi:hypothetical protein
MRHRIAETLPVSNLVPIDEYDHVGPDSTLLVEDVAPCLRVSPEDGLERVANRVALDPGRGTTHMPLDVGSEGDCRHSGKKRERELLKRKR